MGRDAEEGITLLVDLARATDPELRRQVRALAAELILPGVRRGSNPSQAGASRLVTARDGGLELDVEATVEQLVEAPAAPAVPGREVGARQHRRRPGMEDLRWRAWRRPGRAYVLAVDASGSVSGAPLRAAIVTAAALAGRLGADDQLSVLTFWSRAVLLRSVSSPEPVTKLIDRLLSLGGGDTTDLAAGLRLALSQAASAVAPEREVILLTDGLATAGEDPLPVASGAAVVGARVHVLALSLEEESLSCCRALALAGGGQMAVLMSAADAPAALVELLG